MAQEQNDLNVAFRLGVSVWLVERRGWRRRLTRVVRERLTDYPHASAIEWTKGKGVIGLAWQTGQMKLTTLSKGPVEVEAWLRMDEAARRNTWSQPSEEARMGLTYREHEQLVEKYGAVLAFPIFGRLNRVSGVMSVDALIGTEEILDTKFAKETLGAAASVVASLLEDV